MEYCISHKNYLITKICLDKKVLVAKYNILTTISTIKMFGR